MMWEIGGILWAIKKQLYHCLSRHLRTYLAMGCQNMTCAQAYTMSFNATETLEWVLQYRNIWKEVELQLFGKLTTELIKGEYT